MGNFEILDDRLVIKNIKLKKLLTHINQGNNEIVRWVGLHYLDEDNFLIVKSFLENNDVGKINNKLVKDVEYIFVREKMEDAKWINIGVREKNAFELAYNSEVNNFYITMSGFRFEDVGMLESDDELNMLWEKFFVKKGIFYIEKDFYGKRRVEREFNRHLKRMLVNLRLNIELILDEKNNVKIKYWFKKTV